MKNPPIVIISVAAMLSLYSTAYAATWYVHPDSSLNAIQAGIDSSTAGDTVLVGPGTYIENINFEGKAIIVMSEHGPDTTVIDADYNGSVVLFNSGEVSSSVLNGFTITNGMGTYTAWGYLGGGICCTNASSPTIINNIITGNHADYAGGVEFDADCNGLLSYNIITTNTADDAGGGIEFYYASPSISHNTIDDNAAPWGGGISGGFAAPIIKHNQITNNTAYNRGGGIWFGEDNYAQVESCYIANNGNDGIFCGYDQDPTINYNDIVNNQGYAVFNDAASCIINAQYNWWGHATGPYHPDSNPTGLGGNVNTYVDFTPWLDHPVSIQEETSITTIETNNFLTTTVFRGPLILPENTKCRIFDITGRLVLPEKMKPGIYFIQIEEKIVQKVIKIR